jgi:hypothetical protein
MNHVMNTKSLIFLTAALAAVTFRPTPSLQAQQASIGRPLAKQAVLSVLTSNLDTKKSKVGDPVTAKTLNPLKLDDGSVLPAGSKLSGKVTQVQSKSNGGATLAIIFDQVEKKGSSTSTPVHGLVAAVAPAPSLADSGGSAKDLPMGHGGNQAQVAAMTGTGTDSEAAPLPPIQPGSSIKGVVLNPTPAADGSSVLQSTEKNIRLENGTRLEIGLAAAQ